MKLVVQSQETLEILEDLVTSLFVNVPNNGLNKNTFDFPYNENQFPCLFKAVPIAQRDELDLCWIFPPLQKHFKTKPLKYIKKMISKF